MGQTAPLQRSLLDLGPPAGIALQGGGRLSDGDDPVGDAGAGDGVIKGFLHPAAQQLDAVAASSSSWALSVDFMARNSPPTLT